MTDRLSLIRSVQRALFALALVAAVPATAKPFNRSAWIADFEQMKEAITRTSPNLEWAVERGMDLPAVERRARDRLTAANDDAAARFALDRFIQTFADGHMELSWPAASAPSAISTPPRSTCAKLGYRSEPDTSAIATRLPGYEPLGSQTAQIRAGMVTVAGRTVGVLRIPLFAPSDTICAAVLNERGMRADAPCDDACADSVSRRADALFLTEIADRLRQFSASRAEVLLLDVASNGGGNDTSIATARMIGGTDVPAPRMAFVRTATRLKDLEEDEAILREGPSQATAAEQALNERLVRGYVDARAQAAKPCDLTPLWQGQPAGCRNLVQGPFYAGGLTPLPPSGSRTGLWSEIVSSTSAYAYQAARWTKPVLVLVDQNSASSTELLAAMLQDAERAVIVGAPTLGAGCGWNMPKEDVTLRHSGGVLAIPNCARFRRDGRNEIDGIEPDVLVGFRRFDTPRQRAQRLATRLPVAIEAAGRRTRPGE